MAPGLPDRVDCTRLAEDGTVLERVYELSALPRLRDSLADARGSVRARFAFAKIGEGRSGVTVAIEAAPELVCQRCLQGFTLPVVGSSEIEFVSEGSAVDSDRELYATHGGLVSLRDLAEEELLLGLPIVAACSTPLTCGNAPRIAAEGSGQDNAEDLTRPFAALQDLLKKT
jgi:uncharacterized metal-binding protein YceD (DUF177 family)